MQTFSEANVRIMWELKFIHRTNFQAQQIRQTLYRSILRLDRCHGLNVCVPGEKKQASLPMGHLIYDSLQILYSSGWKKREKDSTVGRFCTRPKSNILQSDVRNIRSHRSQSKGYVQLHNDSDTNLTGLKMVRNPIFVSLVFRG